LVTLLVLFVVYFFPIIYCSSAYGLHTGLPAGKPVALKDSRSPVQRAFGGYYLHGNSVSVEGPEEGPYLLSSLGTRFKPNTTVMIPEGSKVLVVFPKPQYNISIIIDEEEAPISTRLELPVGNHMLEAHRANGTAYRAIQVITQEAYKAIHQPKVEPAGLRLKASILAVLSALGLGVPLGAYLKKKRAKPAEL